MTKLPKVYRPTADEDFMNARMLEYFRQRLLSWKAELEDENEKVLHRLRETSARESDTVDCAVLELEHNLDLKARDRARKLIEKIRAALQRIEELTYGYCKETGEPMDLRRLEARPIATLSLEAQERHERLERGRS